LELIILLLLIVLNGFLSLSELAVVSARKVRLQQMADEGNSGAANPLRLADSPGEFLSTVQLGITLIGILAGAFGGTTIAEWLYELLVQIPALAKYAHPLSVGIVVVIVTYLSLVIGELVPKRLALRSAETLAARVAGPLMLLSRLTRPLVRVLDSSGNAILWLMQVKPEHHPDVTEEEVRVMLAQATAQGVFLPLEEEIVDQVFRLADRKVGALLVPRTEIMWIDIASTPEEIRQEVAESGHSRYPVADGELDKILGIILAKDLLAQSLAGKSLDLHSILQPALFVPESTPALQVVERFKEMHSQIAIVIDEYGGVEGLVTSDDILSSLVGDIPQADRGEEQSAIQREDGSWLIDGMYSIDEFWELFDLPPMPEDIEGYYQTLGGFVMASLGQVPQPGDNFTWGGLRLEVIDMDGRRVDKVLVMRLPEDSLEEAKT
jgi:putative hemolysin